MKNFLLKTLHELRHLTTESGSAASTHAYEKETGWRVSDPRTVEFAEPLVAADGWAWLNAWMMSPHAKLWPEFTRSFRAPQTSSWGGLLLQCFRHKSKIFSAITFVSRSKSSCFNWRCHIEVGVLLCCQIRVTSTLFCCSAPAAASGHQPASSVFLSHQFNSSLQHQHSEQGLRRLAGMAATGTGDWWLMRFDKLLAIK